MNITIDREVLLENLNIISRGLPVKSPMPILTGIKLEATDNDLYMTSSNTDIIENIDGDYTGTIEFLDTKKVKVNSSVIQEIKQTDTDGSKYTVKITLRDFISDYYKYSIIRKNGAAYISFGTGDENRPNHYKIVSLTKNSFKLIRDDTWQMGDNQKNPYTAHFEITIISQ
jgi:DNA polymerase-3 subunit beta